MLDIEYTTRFKRDLKLLEKRGKKLDKLKKTIEQLVECKILPQKFRDHKLVGNYDGYRECHIEPDWLLIYKVSNNILFLARTGTHSDLFE